MFSLLQVGRSSCLSNVLRYFYGRHHALRIHHLLHWNGFLGGLIHISRSISEGDHPSGAFLETGASALYWTVPCCWGLIKCWFYVLDVVLVTCVVLRHVSSCLHVFWYILFPLFASWFTFSVLCLMNAVPCLRVCPNVFTIFYYVSYFYSTQFMRQCYLSHLESSSLTCVGLNVCGQCLSHSHIICFSL